MMYKRILVPLDGSELAEQVLPHVSSLAGCNDAEIILLRVPAEPLYDHLMADPQAVAEMRRDVEMGAQVYLDQVASELRELGLKVSTRVVWGGPIHATILDTARELEVDLIAMSTHGRGGLARMLIGSVADQVVRHSPAPVLLVRPEVPRVSRPRAASKRSQAAPELSR